MLTLDTRDMKRELHALIDGGILDAGLTTEQFYNRICEIVEDHKMPINKDQYAAQITKMMLVNNGSRAKKLVDCFDDHVLSRSGELMVKLVRLGVKLALLAAFIVFVVFVYQRCSG